MKKKSHYSYLLFLYTLLIASPVASYANELSLAVANSTCSAIKQVGELFRQHNSVTINYICKSSGRLAKGLNGRSISADIYISANRKWMDYMIKNDMVEPEHVTSPWGNELVLATQKNSPLEIRDWEILTSDKVKKILIGDPGTAPFGRYAKEALQSTGMWNKIKHKIETKKHITLLAETLANADVNTVGILFASNTTAKHRKAYSVDSSWHSPIRYYMAPIKNTEKKPGLSALLNFIRGSKAQKIFRTENFKVDAK